MSKRVKKDNKKTKPPGWIIQLFGLSVVGLVGGGWFPLVIVQDYVVYKFCIGILCLTLAIVPACIYVWKTELITKTRILLFIIIAVIYFFLVSSSLTVKYITTGTFSLPGTKIQPTPTLQISLVPTPTPINSRITAKQRPIMTQIPIQVPPTITENNEIAPSNNKGVSLWFRDDKIKVMYAMGDKPKPSIYFHFPAGLKNYSNEPVTITVSWDYDQTVFNFNGWDFYGYRFLLANNRLNVETINNQPKVVLSINGNTTLLFYITLVYKTDPQDEPTFYSKLNEIKDTVWFQVTAETKGNENVSIENEINIKNPTVSTFNTKFSDLLNHWGIKPKGE